MEVVGASIAVWRQRGDRREWLLLHRAAAGPDYESEWAWTPPAGARRTGESIQECARRELREETGLELDCSGTSCGTSDWAVFVAEATPETEIHLDDEHDRFEWLSLEEAVARCLPARVGEMLLAVAETWDQETSPDADGLPAT
jgi:8-oxo-dGTP pyrophosphatase MutT (NUDIX family)